jgi:tetratricopeptide (TPR) repeat protein/transcriptional regulator with XRE-family HTH domain
MVINRSIRASAIAAAPSSDGTDHGKLVIFGQQLRRSRLAFGLTQEELAKRSGLSVRAISDLERGRTGQPRGSTLRRIEAALSPPVTADEASVRPARSSRPAQLPPDVADFTGRSDEVGRLTAAIAGPDGGQAAGAVIVAAVTGGGGLGKTTLALHVAHRLAALFPDGQLYLNLRGSSQHPVPPAQALARLLRDLGTAPAHIPAEQAERAARYRSLTSGLRLVAVLDDARDAAQVRPLLPGSDACAVIVTSRSTLQDLESAQLLDLSAMTDADAATLFRRIVGRARAEGEPDAVGRVLAACAGLPLAIRIAAARLAGRPAWTIATVADRLSDARNRLDELTAGDLAVRASFTMSYANLRTDPRAGAEPLDRAFRFLALADGPDISLPAAAALLGIAPDSAEAVLEPLVDSHLLQSPAPGRYRFHDLLRLYAAERVHAEDDQAARSAAIRRMLCWYLHTAAAACRVISPQRVHLNPDGIETGAVPLAFDSYAQALAWLDAEQVNLMTAVDQAARAGEHEIAWRLPLALYDLFNLRGRFGDWIAAHQTGLASARLLGDRAAQKYVLGHLAATYSYAGQPLEALGCLREALAIVREAGEEQEIGTALVNLGVVLTDAGRPAEAMQSLQEALRLFRNNGSRYGEAFAQNAIGAIHAQRGRTGDALGCYQQAQQVFREANDIASLSETLADLSALYLKQHQFHEAIVAATEAVGLSRQSGSRRIEARALALLGRAHRDRAEPQQAQQCWRDAMAIFTDLGHPQADEIAADLRALSSAARADFAAE